MLWLLLQLAIGFYQGVFFAVASACLLTVVLCQPWVHRGTELRFMWSGLTPSAQRTSLVLMVLLQAMVSIPLATGHHHLLGMVSYNHFAHSEALNDDFLAALLSPPYRDPLGVPPARHPLLPSPGPMVSPPATADYTELERWLEEHYQEPFRVPVLMRRYAQLGNARVVGLSLARDFNQITEILMHCELDQLTARQRRRLVVDDLVPVWRGLVDGAPSGV